MAIPSMQESHLVEGASNIVPWKLRLHKLLEMANLWYHVEVVVLPTDPKDLAKHNKKAVAVKRLLFDSVKDHLIPRIAEKKTAKNI